jgi:hypothetical protein
MSEAPLLKEYYTLVEIVTEFDRRLTTIKGWGVTLSLASIGFGFQYRHYGFFIVAAASGLAFWSIEVAIKKHQMRYYPRMREIEVIRYQQESEGKESSSSPRIDWSWSRSGYELSKGEERLSPEKERQRLMQPLKLRGRSRGYRWIWLAAHVSLPHAISIVLGLVLFFLAYSCQLKGFCN